MDLSEPIFLYCERVSPGILGEPLNALSNLAFFYWAWALWRQANSTALRTRRALRCLAAIIALVGAGSLAFHVFATAGTRILDLAFIGIFNVLYLIFFLWLVAAWPAYRIVLAVMAFLAADRAAAVLGMAGLYNGSGTYLPAFATLLALSAYAFRLSRQAGRMMALAAVVFLVSITARTFDQAVCPGWPWGTHFVWHLLNAWVLHQLSRALQYGPSPVRP